MVNKQFFENVQEIALARGISVEDVYETFKAALEAGYKKSNNDNTCRVVINPDKSELLLYSTNLVVEELSEEPNPEMPTEILLSEAKKIKSSVKPGDILEQLVNIKNFSKGAIDYLKQNYNQDLRKKQRDKAYVHFKELEGEMIAAEVYNIDDRQITLNLGYNVLSKLPTNELLANDNPKIGDTLRVFIKKVEATTKEPKVSVSRSDRQLVTRLMENYIPEIKQGIIEIKGIARDPGDRSKIALYSNDPKVDPIGSCVGEGGARIRDIVNALGGEKVDLYKWSDEPSELIANSLQPASVTKVLSVDPKTKSSVVVVPNEHLSLAIGKAGQNVRLAVQSCGWKIDIMSTSDAYEKGLLI